MSGTAASSSTATTKPTVRRRGGKANPAQFIYWGLGVIVFFLIVGLIGSQRNKSSSKNNGSEVTIFLQSSDGTQTEVGTWSLDKLEKQDKYISFIYSKSETRSLRFFSKGPVDIYFPSCRRPGTWIKRYYCGEGEFDWSDLKYCYGEIKIFKAKKKKCD